MSIDGALSRTDIDGDGEIGSTVGSTVHAGVDAGGSEQDVTGTLLEILGSHEGLETLLCQQSLWHLEGVPHPSTGCLVCFGS